MTDQALNIRVVLPDLWREEKMEVAADTPVGQIKERALPLLLGSNDANPAEYYVEYFEKEVLDESQTLADLGVPESGVILIRPYDLGHPAPFSG